jgi:hypothetical protein
MRVVGMGMMMGVMRMGMMMGVMRMMMGGVVGMVVQYMQQ